MTSGKYVTTEETKRKMREAHLGKKLSEEHCKNISLVNIGKKLSKETRRKMSLAKKGFKPSEETKRKISNARKGKKTWNFGLTKETDERLKKLSIKFKGHIVSEETRKKISIAFTKEKHPLWLGGLSFEPYGIDFDNELRNKIRERNNFCCGICKKPQGHNNLLDIHHIDYNKQNNKEENLISLCRSCHMKTNYYRNLWINIFENIQQKNKPIIMLEMRRK